MRLCDILTEDVAAPLFHATTPERMVQILRDDILKPTVEPHPLPMAFRRGGKPADWRHAKLVFLTRSLEFAQVWAPCVFVLDQQRLRHRYRIMPIDPLALRRALDHHKSEKTGAIAQRKNMVGRWDDDPIAFPWDEQVEVVEGPIQPLTPYLRSFRANGWVMNELSPEDRAVVEAHPAFDKPFPGSRNKRFGGTG